MSKPDLPGGLDNYFVPRGYAVVLGESLGTGCSDGCPTVGDMNETLGTKAVDRLAQRARARRSTRPATRSRPTGPPATSA